MTATQAGTVQGVYTVAFAVSLLLTSIASDRFGAKRVFNVSMVALAVSALSFGFFARTYESALVFITCLGITQGGTYTPALMMVSSNVPRAKKASAMGWVLAGMSAGYAASIVISNAMLHWYDYKAAFIATSITCAMGVFFGYYATRKVSNTPATEVVDKTPFSKSAKRRAILLTVGYSGHSFELFGAWSWVPAFFVAASVSAGEITFLEIGLWTALALHVTGCFSSLLAGYAADRFGSKRVLMTFALTGMLCSFSIGWLSSSSLVLLVIATAIYGFVIIGDSSVWSSAMTDAVPAHKLGSVLGLRSVAGMGSGAMAPIGFGIVLDIMPAAIQWGLGFSLLGIGGLMALVFAMRSQ